MNVIEVNHVKKEFQLGQLHTVRDSLWRAIAKLKGETVVPRGLFNALDDVSFTVEQGEVLGIIGANGAGKSTLLKLLARITVPTSGLVSVRGKVAPLIEVGAGLISDLTGRENIYLNGIILGMPYAQVRKRFDDIVAFAELEEFIDTPIKRYSSGMAVRLGFSIATCMDADILIVDEVLAVGDLAFQRKCFDRMEDMIKRQGRTVILVSHNTRQIERLCNRVILLDHGRIVADDSPAGVCDLFYERSDEKIKMSNQQLKSTRWRNTVAADDVEVLDVELLDGRGHSTDVVPYKGDIAIRVRFIAHKDIKGPLFVIGVHTTDCLYLTQHGSQREFKLDRLSSGKYEVVCRVNEFPLLLGVYALWLWIGEGHGSSGLFYAENVVHFQVKSKPAETLGSGHRDGFFALDATWSRPTPIGSTLSESEQLLKSAASE
jgi:ABC-type polysaccharide/polyol phosphate transport system ATPase subunit